MLDPRKWERVDQARLFFAVAFGALLGFTSGLDRSGGSLAGLEACGSTYFARSSARSLWAGGSIIIGPLGNALMPRRFPPPWSVEELDACFVVTVWQLGRGNPSRLGIHPPGWVCRH